MKKVLVTDYVHQCLISGLKELGYHVVYAPEMTLPEVHTCIVPFAGMIINTKIKADKSLMEAAPNLEFIGRLGSGLDIIDLDFASERKIRVFSAPEGNRNAVGEHAMGMLLCLANNITRADREVRSFYWNREKNRGFELQGKTVGIIGFGNNGRAFTEKFENWQTSVLAYDKYKEHYCQDLRFVTECDLEKIQQEADIISLHIPLTEETNGWINEKFLKDCKEGVI